MENLLKRKRDQRDTPGQDRSLGLDAYRGIAALLIVVFHVYQYSYQATGAQSYLYEGTPWHLFFDGLAAAMSWFFVLSGFLVFLPWARAAVEAEGRPSVRSYIIRRAIRILPVYYVAIIVVWTWRYYGLEEQWISLLQHLTFTQVFSQKYIFWDIGPAWAIAIIVQFYLFVALVGPLAYKLCSGLAARWSRVTLLAASAMALVVASVGYKWWAFYVAGIPETNWPAYFGPLAKLDNFALGMLLAIGVAAVRERPRVGGPVRYLLGVTGFALMAVSIAYSGNKLVDLYLVTLVAVGFVLILAATVLAPSSSPWLRGLELPPLRYLGPISFGILLWHEPIMRELGKASILISQAPDAFPQNAIILVLLSIVAGALSYVLVEYPTSRLRYLFDQSGRLAQRYPNLVGTQRSG